MNCAQEPGMGGIPAFDVSEDVANNEAQPQTLTETAETESDKLVFGAYSMNDIDDYIKKLGTLTHIECAGMLKSVKSHREEMKNIKSMYDNLKALEQSELGTDLAVQNAEDQIKANNPNDKDFDLESFAANYDANMEALDRLQKALEDKVKEGEEKYSSKFYNDEMIQMLEKRISLLNPDDINYEYNLKRYNVVLNAVQNRTDHNYIIKRLINMGMNKKIRREFLAEMRTKELNIGKMKGLKRLANSDTLTNVEHFMVMHFGHYAKVFLMALNRILLSEERTGKDTWAKQIILNASDLELGMFDLMDPKEYARKLQEDMIPLLLKIVSYDDMKKVYPHVMVTVENYDIWAKYKSTCAPTDGWNFVEE